MTKPIFKQNDTLIDVFKKLSRRKKEYVFRPRDGFICWVQLYEKGYNNLYNVWRSCYWDMDKSFGKQSQETQEILNDIINN
jgi:hypothetical protein